MKRLWPIVLPIKKDELLSSWLIRNSLANGSDPMTWTWFFWGKWRPWTIDFDRHCPETKIEILTSPAFDFQSLEQATLTPIITKILGEQPSLKQTWPWVTRQGSRNRERSGGIRFCSECLKEEPIYFRKAWRLSWNHSCPRHKVLLHEFCTNCSSPIVPHKANFNHPELHLCKRCGYDLTTITSNDSAEHTLHVQSLLNRVITSNNIKLPWDIDSIVELFLTIRFFYIFLNLAAREVTSSDKAICKELGINTPIRPTKFIIESIEKAPPVWTRELDSATSQLLHLNPTEIAEFLSECGATQECFRKNKEIESKTIVFIISQLPANSRNRISTSKKPIEIEPKSKDEVWGKWLELQEYLK